MSHACEANLGLVLRVVLNQLDGRLKSQSRLNT